MYIKIAPISMYISFFFAFIYGFHSLHIQPFIDLDELKLVDDVLIPFLWYYFR